MPVRCYKALLEDSKLKKTLASRMFAIDVAEFYG